MPARALLVASLLQAALVYVPLPTWAAWMVHFASLEACLLGCATGLAAFALARGRPLVRALAVVGVIAGALPALAVAPVYRRERQPFSAVAWLTGRTGPTVTVRRDLALGAGQLADLYPAPGRGPHPFVLVVHGGSWRSGDKGDAAQVSHALALAGISVLDVSYRLAPAGRFPAAVADVKCLLGRARERAAELGLDPARAAILGRSAGGEIALVAAYSDDRIAPSCAVATAPVQAAVSVYGPSDMAWAHAHPFVPDVVRGVEAVEVYLGGTPRTAPEAYRLATPQTWITDATPPTLLVHGTGERCVRAENATMLAAALRARGRSVRTLLVPMADHGFDVRRGGLGEQLARGVIVEFLRERLGVDTPRTPAR
ncbi:MAG: Esterase/lipase-like [Myxococcaceae bacterium]|nr:Esterase/lipase-like [Myxococcaceae bacterium]